MNLIAEAVAWLADPANWTGIGGLWQRLVEHLWISALVLLIAAAISLPTGAVIGHTGRGKGIAVPFAGALRAIPTLGLVTLVALGVGIGLLAPVVALVVIAIPPLLAGAYSGFESVSRDTVDAARAMGMRERQIVGQVEVPLGLPIIVGGIRSAALQVIATTTLAAYVSDYGLGRPLLLGIKTNDYAQAFGAAILVILLALVVDGLFALAQRLSVPPGVRAARADLEPRSRVHHARAAMGQPINEGK